MRGPFPSHIYYVIGTTCLKVYSATPRIPNSLNPDSSPHCAGHRASKSRPDFCLQSFSLGIVCHVGTFIIPGGFCRVVQESSRMRCRSYLQNEIVCCESRVDISSIQASCLGEAISTQSNCSLTDPACSCASPAVQAAAGACVLQSCTIPEALATQNLTNWLCGVPSHDDRTFIPVIYTFVILSSIILTLRFVVRLTERIPLWWDDYSALVSVLISIAFTVLCGVCMLIPFPLHARRRRHHRRLLTFCKLVR